MQLINFHTGKLTKLVGPQYLRAAKSYDLAAFSSLSYPPDRNLQIQIHNNYKNPSTNLDVKIN